MSALCADPFAAGAVQGADPTRSPREFNAGSDAIAQSGNMGNDADNLAVPAQGPQGIQRHVQGFGIQRAEAFIQEERVHADFPAGEAGKSQGEGKTYQKAFSAGKVPCGADFSGLPVIPDRQLQTCAFSIR